jgi:hypothetical protein
VTFSGSLPGGWDVDVTICVTPDYLFVGSNSNFVRVPMDLPAALAKCRGLIVARLSQPPPT